MMYLISIILGAVQGLTEFIPVSSSGHLVVLHEVLHFNMEDNVAFDVALHLGTAIAIIIYFRAEIKRYITVIWQACFAPKNMNKDDLSVTLNIIYASVPAIVIGLLLEGFIEENLRSIWVVSATLVIVAILFFVIEKYSKQNMRKEKLKLGQAVLIGFGQALALIPGVSRSGITITAGMSIGLKREQAASFSFLLGVPIILGAGAYKMLSFNWHNIDVSTLLNFFIGFMVSALVGYFVIKYLLKYLAEHKLYVFAYYRIGLAVLLIAYQIFLR